MANIVSDFWSKTTADDFFNSSQVAAPERPKVDEKTLRRVLGDINSMVGLGRAKEELAEAVAMIQIAQSRNKAGLATELGSFHVVFSGNPGTGKTTFARLYAKALKALGVSSNGHVVEASRSDFVAGYAGQTALKTKDIIKSAVGGVLFIDEAYSLISDERDSYGHEAIAELIKEMEDKRSQLVVVLAGYTQEMDYLLSANPGLRSRIFSVVHFDDYVDEDLVQIAYQMIEARSYTIDSAAGVVLAARFNDIRNKASAREFGNARAARNIVDRMIRSHALRVSQLASPTKKDLQSLTCEDIGSI